MALAVGAVACAAVPQRAVGAVFYPKMTTNARVAFSDPQNWGVGSVDDANADQRSPGEDDWIYYGDAYQPYVNFDLAGGPFKVKGISLAGYKENWSPHHYTLANGTLAFTSGFTNLYAHVTCEAGGTFIVGDSCWSRMGGSGAFTRIAVKESGACTLGGHLILQGLQVNVAAGGAFTLKPAGEVILPTGLQGETSFSNSGLFDMSSGVRLVGDGADAKGSVEFRQQAGVLTLGGDLERDASASAVPVRFVLSGGTLKVTADAAIRGFSSVTMAADSAAAVVVEAGKAFDLSALAFGEGASLTKTGAGTLKLGVAAPAGFALAEGVVEVCGTAFGSLTLGAGVSIVPSASLGEGDVVFSGTDAGEVAAAANCLSAAPEGLAYRVANGVVSLSRTSVRATDFVADGETSLSSAASWGASRVPAGDAVVVRGEKTVGVFDAQTPAFQSITVAEGATLKVVGTVDNLPPIALANDARILFAEGASVVLPAGFSATANPVQVPVFEVAIGAVVNVGASRKFKNVHVKLYGQIDWDANVWFGFAEAGETTYAGFDADGGTLRCLTAGTEKIIRWLEPAAGGRVSVPGGKLTMRDMATAAGETGCYYGESFGFRNPVDEKVEILLDNTVINQYGTTMYVAGGVTIHAVNGGGIRKPGSLNSWGFYNRIILRDEGRLVLDGESLFQYHYSRYNVEFNPSSDGFEQVVVRDGSWMAVQYPQGTGGAMARFEDGWWDVMRLPNLDPGSRPEITDARMWTTNVFHGFKGVVVPAGRFVGIRSSDCWDRGTPWDPVAVLDPDAPISGAGSLVVSNATPGRAFSVVVTSAGNAATGEAKVLPSDDPATLYFADGATWAGTVVADGRVALTNCASSGAAAVTFGTLELKGKFPVRLWKDGATVASDSLNLTSAVNGPGGLIRPVPMAGSRPSAGDVFGIGSIDATAETLPAVAKGWTIRVGEAVSGRRPLLLERTPPGGMVIIR